MQSVIGTKMQQKFENSRAYTDGQYILNGPGGPIDPWDWDDKISPGCTVELKLTGTETTGQISRYRSRHRHSRPPHRGVDSMNTAVRQIPFTPAPLERIDTSRQIEYPEYSPDGPPDRDADSRTSGEFNESASVHDDENAVGELHLASRVGQPEPSTQMPLALRRWSSLNSDASIHTATGEQLVGVPRLSRRSTDHQSFVEDFDEDSEESSIVAERASSVNFADPLPPGEATSVDSRISYSMTRSDEPSSGSAESTKQDSSSRPESPKEPPGDGQPDAGAEKPPMRPIFAWKVAASDGLPSTLMEKGEPMLGYKDADKTIRAILEEREAEAALYLLKREREKDIFDSLPECSRREVLAKVKVISDPLDGLSAIERSARKRSIRKKQALINNAIEILDAFVPVQYQGFHPYWLIKKFYGALLAMTSKYVSRSSSLDGRKSNYSISSAIPISTRSAIVCPCSSEPSGRSTLGSQAVVMSNPRPSTFPRPW